jgi:RNA polymerase sigma factor (sigma-70 family)
MAGDFEGLAGRLERREPGAEEEFVQAFAGRVEGMLRSRLRDREAAREVANDVLLAVLRAVPAGRLQDRARLGAFVMGTARNLANGYCRKRARRPVEQELGDDCARWDGAPYVEHQDRLRVVFDRMQALDDVDRSIVGLTLAQGLGPNEIARALHMSPMVVRTRKSRAIRRLTAQLAGCASAAA